MNTKTKGSASRPQTDADLGRSHAIFIAVGVAIILGGLWLLYSNTGPYHPDIPVSETQAEDVFDS